MRDGKGRNTQRKGKVADGILGAVGCYRSIYH